MRTMEWSVILTALAAVLASIGFLIMYTQRSLSALRTEIRADMRDLRTEMRDMRTELLTAIKSLDDRVRV